MLSSVFVIPLLGFAASAVAQSSVSVVCVAGQCLQGFSNTTIGAKLSAPGFPTALQLLPGQYASTTSPQLLHNLLTSKSASLTPSAGFSNASSVDTLPLNLNLDPGVAIFSGALYSGQTAFSPLPSVPIVNTSAPLNAISIALSSNVWIAVSSGSNSNERVIIWDSVPDVNQLALASSSSLSMSLLDVQSSSCSPTCSGSGVCSPANTCVCPPNFTGSSCESCAPGFFGPSCKVCPSGCAQCDEGTTGTGRCLTPEVPDTAPAKCNCLSGVCSSTGGCQCNPGWIDSEDGTKCGKCATGFFQTSTGDCQVCQLGCTQCSDTTGTCIACKTGFTQDPNDRTKCDPVQAVTSTGTLCPDTSFSDGQNCKLCSPTCRTCNGPTSNDCIVCATGQYVFNGGSCVSANSDGVCEGTGGMIADNNKNECDTCGAKCTACKIPNFNGASTVNQLQCTGCLPGFVLSNGKCIESCPAGTFVSPQDNLTCIPCSSSCSTCSGAADFCLSCSGSLLASSGKCVSACPSSTFPSTVASNTNSAASSACLTCHSDCTTCSGSSFNQCTSCPPSRPVLSNGRCLPTCSKSQFFDPTTNTCQACDGSCESCSGPGANRCLACSSSSQVLRSGTCVSANCNGVTNVIPGLGVCLSDLVQVPPTTGTGTASPLPSITGLGEPTAVVTGRRLEWWQILLMALGCAFIFIAILWCWRRKAKKDRKKRTEMFARVKKIKEVGRWNWTGWGRWFGRKKKAVLAGDEDGEGGDLPVAYNHHDKAQEEIKLGKLQKPKSVDEKNHTPLPTKFKRKSLEDLESYIDAYDYSRHSMSIHSRTPSTLPDLDGYYRPRDKLHRQATGRTATTTRTQRTIERESMYSEMTGVPRHTPEPRMPLKRDLMPLGATTSSLPFSRSRGNLNSDRQSLETSSSVVIKPEQRQREGVLVDLDANVDGNANRENATLPLQLQLPTTQLMQQQEIMKLTDAQAYAMTVRPGLQVTGALAMGVTAMPLPWNPSGNPLLPNISSTSAGLNQLISAPITNAGLGAAGVGMGLGGSYWMKPPSPTAEAAPLKPVNTGSSGSTTMTGGSKNPFRQAGW